MGETCKSESFEKREGYGNNSDSSAIKYAMPCLFANSSFAIFALRSAQGSHAGSTAARLSMTESGWSENTNKPTSGAMMEAKRRSPSGDEGDSDCGAAEPRDSSRLSRTDCVI